MLLTVSALKIGWLQPIGALLESAVPFAVFRMVPL